MISFSHSVLYNYGRAFRFLSASRRKAFVGPRKGSELTLAVVFCENDGRHFIHLGEKRKAPDCSIGTRVNRQTGVLFLGRNFSRARSDLVEFRSELMDEVHSRRQDSHRIRRSKQQTSTSFMCGRSIMRCILFLFVIFFIYHFKSISLSI